MKQVKYILVHETVTENAGCDVSYRTVPHLGYCCYVSSPHIGTLVQLRRLGASPLAPYRLPPVAGVAWLLSSEGLFLLGIVTGNAVNLLYVRIYKVTVLELGHHGTKVVRSQVPLHLSLLGLELANGQRLGVGAV